MKLTDALIQKLSILTIIFNFRLNAVNLSKNTGKVGALNRIFRHASERNRKEN